MCGNINFSWSLPDRIENICKLPEKIGKWAGSSLRTSVGLAATVGSVATLGIVPFINKQANRTIHSSHLGSKLFRPIMKVINPKFSVATDAADINGILTRKIAEPIFAFAKDLEDADVFLAKEVLSRAAFLTGALAATATRTVEIVMGLFGALGSALTLGALENCNTFAIRNLNSTLVLHDLSVGLRGFFNPHQQLVLEIKGSVPLEENIEVAGVKEQQ